MQFNRTFSATSCVECWNEFAVCGFDIFPLGLSHSFGMSFVRTSISTLKLFHSMQKRSIFHNLFGEKTAK